MSYFDNIMSHFRGRMTDAWLYFYVHYIQQNWKRIPTNWDESHCIQWEVSTSFTREVGSHSVGRGSTSLNDLVETSRYMYIRGHIYLEYQWWLQLANYSEWEDLFRPGSESSSYRWTCFVRHWNGVTIPPMNTLQRKICPVRPRQKGNTAPSV